MNDEVRILKNEAEKARVLLRSGIIDLTEAKVKVKPYIDLVNKKSKEIAKKYNQRPRMVTASSFLR
nr:MAG TPA: hypothetical protein [Caudoviricetes sp.]